MSLARRGREGAFSRSSLRRLYCQAVRPFLPTAARVNRNTRRSATCPSPVLCLTDDERDSTSDQGGCREPRHGDGQPLSEPHQASEVWSDSPGGTGVEPTTSPCPAPHSSRLGAHVRVDSGPRPNTGRGPPARAALCLGSAELLLSWPRAACSVRAFDAAREVRA